MPAQFIAGGVVAGAGVAPDPNVGSRRHLKTDKATRNDSIGEQGKRTDH
jgi:hypothetical protein